MEEKERQEIIEEAKQVIEELDNKKNKFEEVKPNLWVRKSKSGIWVQFYPIKKNPNLPNYKGNINWRNLFLGGNVNITLVLFIMLLLIFAYQNDIKAYKDYYEKTQFYFINYTIPECTQDLQEKGLCISSNNLILNEGEGDKNQNTNNIQGSNESSILTQ